MIKPGTVLSWQRLLCGVLMAAGGCLAAGQVNAQSSEIVQGRLALHWGDPAPVGRMQVQRPPRFRALLLADDGRRIPLDADQARRAAGDLYALANRRIAVSFTTAPASPMRRAVPAGQLQRRIEVIVPADRLDAGGGAVSAAAQVLAAAPVTGTTRWVTLMCKFSDIASEQKNQAFFASQYGSAVGQLGHYWSEVSYGQINLAGSTAHGWFVLPQPRSTYVTVKDGEDDADLDRLFQDCVAAADAQVDFTGVQGINMMFNGELDGFAWGGGACATMDGTRRCPRVTWNPPWSFNNLAPLAHEMGHGYGLPHSDNSDGDDDTYDNPWDVMSDGWSNAVRDAMYGIRPKHINILQRDRLGWLPAARKLVIPAGSNGNWQVELEYASLANAGGRQMILLSMPTQADPSRTVTYTLEARRRVGDYEAMLAGDAVIIHRVLDGTAYSEDASVPPANVSNNEGSMFKAGETWTSPDGLYRVSVDGMTARGFLVTVSAYYRVTGGNLAPRTGTPPAAQAAPAVSATPTPAARAPLQRRTRWVDRRSRR